SKSDQGIYCTVEPFKSALARHGIYGRADLPLGCVVGVGRLVDAHRVEDIRGSLSKQELAFGNYSDGRFAWEFREMQRLEQPVPAIGSQRIWTWRVPDETAAQLNLVD